MISYSLERARETHLDESLKSTSLDLIVEAIGRKDKIATELSRFGKVTNVYDFIPYISVHCNSKDALALVISQSRGNRYLRSQLGSIDAASSFTIPKPSHRKAMDDDNWNLENIGAYEAQKISIGEGVRVGIIDTGIEYNHPEVAASFDDVKGYDFVKDDENPVDENGHGTHVAGIVAGQNYGVAPGATLYAIRVLDSNGSGSEKDVISGIEWAIKNELDIINMSLGSPVASSAFERICSYAASMGMLICAAAGNDGGEYANYPAAFGDSVIAVAAVDRYNRHAYFSNIFDTNDISAPGVDIVSSVLNGGYESLSGTSMASPHVAGALALALPVFEGENIYDFLAESAQPLGERDVFGSGLVRCDKLVGEQSLMNIIKSILW